MNDIEEGFVWVDFDASKVEPHIRNPFLEVIEKRQEMTDYEFAEWAMGAMAVFFYLAEDSIGYEAGPMPDGDEFLGQWIPFFFDEAHRRRNLYLKMDGYANSTKKVLELKKIVRGRYEALRKVNDPEIWKKIRKEFGFSNNKQMEKVLRAAGIEGPSPINDTIAKLYDRLKGEGLSEREVRARLLAEVPIRGKSEDAKKKALARRLKAIGRWQPLR